VVAVETVTTDVLVVGSGFAGLWAAITAADAGADVTIVDKASIARSSQSRMSAGATIYLLDDDDLDAWVDAVAGANGGLCRRDLVTAALGESASRLRALEGWGVSYAGTPGSYVRLPSRGLDGVRMLVRPVWRRRVGGSAVVGALREQVVRRRVRLMSRHLVTEILRDDGGNVAGVVALDRTTAAPVAVSARAVVLAAADCSFRGNYACTDAVTGDAFRLAFDAGATLTNMEFLCTNTGPAAFGFEGTGVATRAGGRFVDAEGRAFMWAYDPEADCAEVCHISQAMAAELDAGNGPLRLDLSAQASPGSFLRNALGMMGGFMPVNLAKLAAAGIDVFDEAQEWVPAVQTLRGGVRTDDQCSSDIPGLFAAGLSQSMDPGLFNGWSSMRAMWSGGCSGFAAAGHAAGIPVPVLEHRDLAHRAELALAPLHRSEDVGPTPRTIVAALQDTLFPYDVSIRKDPSSLLRARSTVDGLHADAGAVTANDPHELAAFHETLSMLTSARLFLTASLERTESRGDHFRTDRPERDDERWLRWIRLTRAEDGRVLVAHEAVPATGAAA